MEEPLSESYFIVEEEQCSNSNLFEELSVISSNSNTLILRAKRYGRWWVLKALSEEHRGQQLYRRLLQKEFDLLISLQNENIVSTFSLEELPEWGMVIVMEWVDGVTLSEWLKKSPHIKEKARIVTQLLDVLSYIHRQQITHRDLKPVNILVTRNGDHVKLIDFGLSDSDDYALFKQPGGTEGYISPEQKVKHQTDVRNDIYSLGCVLKDMQLGWRYADIVRRCLLPEKNRYAYIDLVRRSFYWRKYFFLIVGVILSIVIFICCISAIYNRQKELNNENIILTRTIDSLQGKIYNVQQHLQKNESEALRLEKEKIAKIDLLIVDIKKGIDSIVALSSIEDMQIKSKSTYDKYTKNMESLMEQINQYIQKNIEVLPTTDRMVIDNELYSNYLQNKYYNRWIDKMTAGINSF